MLVLLADGWTNGWSTMNLFCVYRSSWRDPLGYIRLFGHVLGHANWEHFLNNMLLLLVVGPPMEEKYGSIPLLKGILFTALVTGVPVLTGAAVTAMDLRGGAALIVAGLTAEGETEIVDRDLITRGYEHLDRILRALGADITYSD